MADTDISLALQRIKEKVAALNFATDAIMLLLEKRAIQPSLADLQLRRLSARRTDLRDERMAIIDTQQVTDVPSPAQVRELRLRVAALFNFNRASDAIDGLVAEALAIATSS